MNITDKISLAYKFELTQQESSSKSQHYLNLIVIFYCWTEGYIYILLFKV